MSVEVVVRASTASGVGSICRGDEGPGDHLPGGRRRCGCGGRGAMCLRTGCFRWVVELSGNEKHANQPPAPSDPISADEIRISICHKLFVLAQSLRRAGGGAIR